MAAPGPYRAVQSHGRFQLDGRVLCVIGAAMRHGEMRHDRRMFAAKRRMLGKGACQRLGQRDEGLGRVGAR